MPVATDDFVHLHVHTEFSLLDGHSTPEEVVAAAAELGQPAIAISDHGNPFGHYTHYQAAKAAGIDPICGLEAYVAPSGPNGEPSDRTARKRIKWRQARDDGTDTIEGGKDVSGGGRYTHQTMWAYNSVGLSHLWAMAARGSAEGTWVKQEWARIDHDLMRTYREGIIASTGCPSGEIATRLRLGQMQLAYAAVERDLEIWGRDHYFLEIMDHGIQIEKEIRDGLMHLMHRYNLRPLATNDTHYTRESDAPGHNALLAIQTGKQLSDPKRFKFDGSGYYIKSGREMRDLFDDEVPGACDNTLLVAEMVTGYEENFRYLNRMPKIDVPDGFTVESYLRHLVEKGLRKRYRVITDEVRTRVEYELELIIRLGFADYFLVLFDLCEWMRSQDILFGPRGSAAGSIIIYALEVSNLDPLRFELAFERFINPDRVSPPDVDLDIADDRREEVIRYLGEKYGHDKVASIITFKKIGGRNAVLDSARILGFPAATGAMVSKAYPPNLFGKSMTLKQVFDPTHPRNVDGDAAAPLRELMAADDTARQTVELARSVEQRLREFGLHACGEIVAGTPLLGQIPLETNKDDGTTHIGFKYVQAEAMGFQKFDALGLANWRIVAQVLAAVKANHGADIDVFDDSFDDPAVYELLAKGHTLGVFQLESTGMQGLLKMMRPTTFTDIMAVLALYRPGPMGMQSHHRYALRKNGLEKIIPIHAELQELQDQVLGKTYGVITFQEQVMSAVRMIAGFTPGRADLLRKAMGKKDKEVLDKEKIAYFEGAAAKGFSAAAAEALWATIEPFADYAFNAAHTACYGQLAYLTALLKAKYPVEFMAATLQADAHNKKKLGAYLAECRRMGIDVGVPDVNASGVAFTPTTDGRILFGLAGVASVGPGAAQAIVDGRQRRPYADLKDFLERAGADACTKPALEGLAESGAFDSIEKNRRVVFVAAEKAAKAAATAKKALAKHGAIDLFTAQIEDAAPDQISLAGLELDRALRPFDRLDALDRERKRIGLYLSGHPLDGLEATLAANRTDPIADVLVAEHKDGDQYQLSGMITEFAPGVAKKSGKPYAKIVLEDLHGSIELLFFARAFEECREALAVGNKVAVRVKAWVKEIGGGAEPDSDDPDAAPPAPEVEVTMSAFAVKILEILDPERPVIVWLTPKKLTGERIGALKQAVQDHPGPQKIQFALMGDDQTPRDWRSPEMRVQLSAPLVSEIKEVIGRGAFTRKPRP